MGSVEQAFVVGGAEKRGILNKHVCEANAGCEGNCFYSDATILNFNSDCSKKLIHVINSLE